jgi:hypothetical protein
MEAYVSSEEKRRWSGPVPECQHCGRRPKEWFVDGYEAGKPDLWSIFCEQCWEQKGNGVLAQGYGQKYDATTLEQLGGHQPTAEDEAFAMDLARLVEADAKYRPN